MVAPFPLDTGMSGGITLFGRAGEGGTMPASGMRWIRSHSASPELPEVGEVLLVEERRGGGHPDRRGGLPGHDGG